MSRNYKIRNQEALYFVSFATVNWIDAFTRLEYKEVITTSLKYCIGNKGLELYAWCIMSSPPEALYYSPNLMRPKT